MQQSRPYTPRPEAGPRECPTCGQTILDPEPLGGVALGPVSSRLVRRLLRAGPQGMRSDLLFQHLYGHDPDGGPLHGLRSMHVIINKLNHKLLPLGRKIISDRSARSVPGYYKIVELQQLHSAGRVRRWR